MSKYLINEPPLLILPGLAKSIGLNEAIFLQQLHYWLKISKHDSGGCKWVYNTYAQWLKQFPFWSQSTLKRMVRKLEKTEIIVTVIEISENINKTKWYRIDYSVLNKYTGLSPDLNSGTNLIIDDYPLMFQPSLAMKYGLNGAIFLQQLHYWLAYNSKERDNQLWVVHKYSQWLEQFSFWSKNTLIKTIDDLSEAGAIKSTNKYNDNLLNNLRWLSINYEVINSHSFKENHQSTDIEPTSTDIDTTSTDIDTTSNDIDTTSTDIEPKAYQNCTDGVPELTSCPIYYTETNTETTETKAESEIIQKNLNITEEQKLPSQEKNNEVKVNGLTNRIRFGKEAVEASFSNAIEYYRTLIDSTKTIRKNDSRLDDIQKLMNKHGANVIDILFDNIKKSDFLLGYAANFNPSFSFILNNADKIISGQYESESDSMYEKAQKCCKANKTCTVITENYPKKNYCKYCNQYANKEEKPKKTQEELENEMFESCKAKDYCTLKRIRRTHSPFPYCIKCPKNDFIPKENNEDELIDKARKCYDNCNGCCSVRVMKTEALEHCKFCPGIGTDPDESDKIIKADPADSEAVWSAAFKWADKKNKEISGFIKDFEIFSTYSISDYKQEVLIVVFKVLQELLAENAGVVELIKFEKRIWNHFRNSFTKNMQTIPAMRDIFKSGNKATCTFLDFDELQETISNEDEVKAENSRFKQDILKELLGVLTIREEEVLDYVLGFTAIGKLSQRETAELMGTTRENVAVIQRKALDKIIAFCKEYNISDYSSLETIKFKIRTYQKQTFKDTSNYQVFEIGSLINQIAG